MTKIERLEVGWLSYAALVLPDDADEIQISETRKAFYAGASAIFDIMSNGVSEGPGVTAADMQLMDDLYEELTDFLDREQKRILQ